METKKEIWVDPCNDVQDSIEKFDGDCHDEIRNKKLTFRTKSFGKKPVEFIECLPWQTNEALEYIDSQGYVSAPSPYVLGFGIQYPELCIEKYQFVVSLDNNNIFKTDKLGDCFLSLNYIKNTGRILCLASRKGYWKSNGPAWYLMVIKKENLA